MLAVLNSEPDTLLRADREGMSESLTDLIRCRPWPRSMMTCARPSLQAGGLHLDMLCNPERLNAFFDSVAHPIMDKSALLIESGLRNAG